MIRGEVAPPVRVFHGGDGATVSGTPGFLSADPHGNPYGTHIRATPRDSEAERVA